MDRYNANKLVFFIVVFASFNLTGQIGVIKPLQQPQKVGDVAKGNSGRNVLKCVREMSEDNDFDRDVLLGGTSYSSIGGDIVENVNGGSDYWVMMVDSTDNPVWNVTLGGDGQEEFAKLEWQNRNNLIVAGSSNSEISGDVTEDSRGGWDYWIVRMGDNGNVKWDKRYGGSGDDFLQSIYIVYGDIYLVGYSNSPASGEKSEGSRGGFDYWLVKIDADGNKIWDLTLGGTGEDQLKAVYQLNNLLLVGDSNSPASDDKSEDSFGGKDIWAVCVTPDGDVLWDKTLGGEQDEIAADVVYSNNSRFMVGGSSNSPRSGNKTAEFYGGYDYWVFEIDQNGTLGWQKSFGGQSNDYLADLLNTPEGGSVVAGSSAPAGATSNKTTSNYGGEDYWIIRLDSEGGDHWQAAYGGDRDDHLYSVDMSCDRGLLMAGSSASAGGSGNKEAARKGEMDYWYVRTLILSYPNFLFQEEVCLGDTIEFFDNSQLLPDKFVWRIDGEEFNSKDKSYVFRQIGEYEIYHGVKEGCQEFQDTTKVIRVIENKVLGVLNLEERHLLCNTESVLLDAGNNIPPTTSIMWSNGVTEASQEVTEPGTYTVEITVDGCREEQSTIVASCPILYVPTGFNPNGNGLNEEFRISLAQGATEFYQIDVYNRWGEMMFTSQDPEEGWDGTYNGANCLTGAYAYKIVYQGLGDNQQAMKTGYFYLVR